MDIWIYEVQRQCYERNIGTIKKRINKRVKVTLTLSSGWAQKKE